MTSIYDGVSHAARINIIKEENVYINVNLIEYISISYSIR